MRFLLIDRIVSLLPGHSAAGVKTFSPDEDCFRDHFPGYAVVPGVLLLESMAQLGGRLIEATVREDSGREVLPVLGMISDAKFLVPVRPDDCIGVSVELKSLKESAARVTARLTVNDRTVASGEITYVLLKLDDDSAGMSPADLDRLRTWSREVWQQLLLP